jgi:hypothetical protein
MRKWWLIIARNCAPDMHPKHIQMSGESNMHAKSTATGWASREIEFASEAHLGK